MTDLDRLRRRAEMAAEACRRAATGKATRQWVRATEERERALEDLEKAEQQQERVS